MNILIIGTGAIGSYYGSLLAKGGAEVSVVARSDYEQVLQHGIDIRSDKLGEWQFKPHTVLRDAAEVSGKPDYVVCCVKMVEGVDQAALVRGAVGPDTALVLIANGIGVEAKLADAYSGNELISGLAFICVTRTAPGKIWHQDYGSLTLGLYPRGSSAKTKALTTFSCVLAWKA